MIKDFACVTDDVCKGFGKNLNDGVQCKGHINLKLYGPDGKLKDERDIHNTVTTLGKNATADQWLDTPTKAKPGWIELGTGSPGTTKLGAYVAGSRTALTSKTRSDNVVTMVASFAAGVGTGALTEAGVFNVATEDTAELILSATFGTMTKEAADALTITWTFTVN